MQYYFSDIKLELGNDYEASFDDAHHMINVMRMKMDSLITVTDCNQVRFLCKITKIEKKQVFYKPIEVFKKKMNRVVNVKLIYSLVKQDKFEFVLQKSCELGVTEIIPYLADYSIIKFDVSKEEKKIARWQKILKEASEQSQRYTIPILHNVASTKDIIAKHLSQTNIICATEDVETQRLNKLINTNDISIIIGPEGGFSQRELDYFKSNNFAFARLSDTILRTETAAIYALSVIDAFKSEE